MQGTIKNIVVKKAFGFIGTVNGAEYFFHREDFQGHWDDLTRDYETDGGGTIPVSFKGVSTPKGPRAQNVKRIDHPNQAV